MERQRFETEAQTEKLLAEKDNLGMDAHHLALLEKRSALFKSWITSLVRQLEASDDWTTHRHGTAIALCVAALWGDVQILMLVLRLLLPDHADTPVGLSSTRISAKAEATVLEWLSRMQRTLPTALPARPTCPLRPRWGAPADNVLQGLAMHFAEAGGRGEAAFVLVPVDALGGAEALRRFLGLVEQWGLSVTPLVGGDAAAPAAQWCDLHDVGVYRLEDYDPATVFAAALRRYDADLQAIHALLTGASDVTPAGRRYIAGLHDALCPSAAPPPDARKKRRERGKSARRGPDKAFGEKLRELRAALASEAAQARAAPTHGPTKRCWVATPRRFRVAEVYGGGGARGLDGDYGRRWSWPASTRA